MAVKKQGLVYYSVDTDRYQDIRIKKLKKNLGTNGLAIYDFILCEIYRVKGCFLVWDDSTVFDVADYFNVKESLIIEVVNYCAGVGLFHKGLLDRERIITSHSIQIRYLDACIRSKRKSVDIPEKYTITPERSRQNPDECPKPPEESTQSKVKESKEEESKVKNDPPAQVFDENFHQPKNQKENSRSPGAKNWNTKPGPDEINLPLPEIKIGSVIELLRITKGVDVDSGQINGLWSVFKAQAFNGVKYYQDESEVYSHFINWCQKKEIKKNAAHNQSTGKDYSKFGKSAGAIRAGHALAKELGIDV